MVWPPFVIVFCLTHSIAVPGRRTTELLSMRYFLKRLLHLVALHAAILTIQPTLAMRFLNRPVPISTLFLRIPISPPNGIDSFNANSERLVPRHGPRTVNREIIILAGGREPLPEESASAEEPSELSHNRPLVLLPAPEKSQKRIVGGLAKSIVGESNLDEAESPEEEEDRPGNPLPIRRIRRHAVVVASGFPFGAIKSSPVAFMEASSENENTPLKTATEPETAAPKTPGLTPAPHLFYALESR